MIDLSGKFGRIFPWAINGLFVLSGIVMIACGIYESAQGPKEADQLGVSKSRATTDGRISIAIGCIDILVGGLGLATTFLKKSLMLYLYAGLLASTILGNIFFLIGFSIDSFDGREKTRPNMAVIITKMYGNNSRWDGKRMTYIIDLLQREAPCCGFSGLDGENLYLKSPWYKEINKNVTSKPRTLPDSCCTMHKPECREAKNVPKAREAGFVHKEECVDTIYARYDYYVWKIILEIILSAIIQIGSLAFTILQVLEVWKGSSAWPE